LIKEKPKQYNFLTFFKMSNMGDCPGVIAGAIPFLYADPYPIFSSIIVPPYKKKIVLNTSAHNKVFTRHGLLHVYVMAKK
jgi:hypothetical protein